MERVLSCWERRSRADSIYTAPIAGCWHGWHCAKATAEIDRQMMMHFCSETASSTPESYTSHFSCPSKSPAKQCNTVWRVQWLLTIINNYYHQRVRCVAHKQHWIGKMKRRNSAERSKGEVCMYAWSLAWLCLQLKIATPNTVEQLSLQVINGQRCPRVSVFCIQLWVQVRGSRKIG